MESREMFDFLTWYAALLDLAIQKGVECLVSSDKEHYRESYEDGLTPGAVLDWLIETANNSKEGD